MNLIIKETDPRYSYLTELFNMNYNQFIKYSDYRSIYYLVPKGLMISGSSDRWINCRRLGSSLIELCNFNIQCYYELVINHNNDLDNTRRCDGIGCSNKVTFVSMSQGYHKSGLFNDNSPCYCSNKCQRLAHEQYNKECLNSKIPTIKRLRSFFINHSDGECYLYLFDISDSTIKFGITSSIESRIHTLSSYKGIDILNSTILYEGTATEVANIEAAIKMKYGTSEYLPSSKKSELINYVTKLTEGPSVNQLDFNDYLERE